MEEISRENVIAEYAKRNIDEVSLPGSRNEAVKKKFKRPLTTAFHEQGRKRLRAYENYEFDSTKNIASPSNGEFELAKKALNSTVGK